MGNRHQIYIKTKNKTIVKPSEINNVTEAYETRVVPMHNQNFDGFLPVAFALNLMRDFVYNMTETENIYKEQGQNLAEYLVGKYQFCRYGLTDFDTFVPTVLEDKVLALSPSMADNNDGITVIDLSGKFPKYAFMFLKTYDFGPPAYRILSADDYLEFYFNAEEHDKVYWENNQTELMECLSLRQQFKHSYSILELLTVEELKCIFPRDEFIQNNVYKGA